MIDVHIAHLRGERDDWRHECEASLEGHPIQIHHVEGINGDIRQTRLNGFLMGQQEYVSFVDPDDVVHPGAFDVLVEALQSNPSACGAYSLSNKIDASGYSLGLIHPYRKFTRDYLARNLTEIHQLVVMRRSALTKVFTEEFNRIPKVGYAEVTLFALMSHRFDWVAVNHVGYSWRVHNNGAHVQELESHHVALDHLRRLHKDIVSGPKQININNI